MTHPAVDRLSGTPWPCGGCGAPIQHGDFHVHDGRVFWWAPSLDLDDERVCSVCGRSRMSECPGHPGWVYSWAAASGGKKRLLRAQERARQGRPLPTPRVPPEGGQRSPDGKPADPARRPGKGLVPSVALLAYLLGVHAETIERDGWTTWGVIFVVGGTAALFLAAWRDRP